MTAAPASPTSAASRRWAYLLGRVRHDLLVRSSGLVMATTAANGVLGYAFWVLAARLHPEREVGRAAALLAVVAGVSLVANLGVGSALVAVLPHRAQGAAWSRSVLVALGMGAAASAAVGLAVGVVTPALIGDGGARWRTVALVAAGAAGTSAGGVLDAVFLSERRAEYLLARNAGFGLGKLLLLGAFGAGTATAGIVGSWVLALTASAVVAVALGFPRLGRGFAPRGAFRPAEALMEARGLVGPSVLHHLTNLGAQLPAFALPLVVIARAGPDATARFSIAWLVGGVFFTVSVAIAASLFAEGCRHPGALAPLVRRSNRLATALLLPTMAVMVLAGPWVLGAFGASYRQAYPLLLVLVAAAVPDAVLNLGIARWRVQRRLRAAAAVNLATGGLAIGLAWWWVPAGGIVGAGAAWLVAQLLGAAAVLLNRLHATAPSPGRAVPVGEG
jgi:O-antigen/teichoic acid export membrane protein